MKIHRSTLGTAFTRLTPATRFLAYMGEADASIESPIRSKQMVSRSARWLAIVLTLLVANLSAQEARVDLYPKLSAYVDARLAEFDQIDSGRQQQLIELANYVSRKRQREQPAKLNFICTHNSRRSHMAQLWAAAAAAYYGLDGVETFSGGTLSTAFNPRAVAALERAGFQISRPAAAENPRFRVSFSPTVPPQDCFSKIYLNGQNSNH